MLFTFFCRHRLVCTIPWAFCTEIFRRTSPTFVDRNTTHTHKHVYFMHNRAEKVKVHIAVFLKWKSLGSMKAIPNVL